MAENKILNEKFEPYRDKHIGESCLVFGTGPTVNLYPNKDVLIKLGANEIIYKPYKMDYYFIGDRGDKNRGYESDKLSYEAYHPNMAYFYRNKSEAKFHCNSFINNELPGISYKYSGQFRGERMPSDDITKNIFIYSTILVEVMQFAVFCGFSRIYLIGVDCDYSKGSFISPEVRQDTRVMSQVWGRIKGWLDRRGVECFSINPVGLTMFPTAEYEEL